MSPTILVTGASGHLGGLIVQELLAAQSHHKVLAASSHLDKIRHLEKDGAQLVHLDFADIPSMEAGFAGVDIVVMVSVPLQVPCFGQIQLDAVKAAESAGVKHVIYTSALNPRPGVPIAEEYFWTEVALFTSKMKWTCIRYNFYHELVLNNILPGAIQSGEFASHYGQGQCSFIGREDCGAFAAAVALKASQFENLILDADGPENLDMADIMALQQELTGVEVKLIDLTAAEMQARLEQFGLPGPLAAAYTGFQQSTRQNYTAILSSSFEDIVGRKPETMRSFLTRHQKTLQNIQNK